MSETDAGIRRYKVSLEQLNLLIDFMSQHGELAAGTYRTMEGRHRSKLLWNEIAKQLNGHKGGIKRPSHGWSKYWSDFKIKLKNKMIDLKKRQMGVLKKEISPMSKLEKRALHILGPNFEKKYIEQGRFEDMASGDPLPTTIKQELVTVTNGYYKATSDSNRLSGNESDHSPQQSEEEIEEGEQSMEEPVIDHLYPKWLIEVEQKRAEAELRRAKAEELRAEVAVKTAEAAFVQSQALRKLSDAADRQADAILRIAMALESRRSRDDILL